MPRTRNAVAAFVVIAALSLGTIALAGPVASSADRPPAKPSQPDRPPIGVDPDYLADAYTAAAINLQRIEDAVFQLENEVGEYVASVIEIEQQQAAALLARTRVNVSTSSTSGRGPLTQAQLAALNICEASGQNGWRTGMYGLETGTGDVGSWPVERQQAEVQRIYAEHGASAWGVACRDEIGG